MLWQLSGISPDGDLLEGAVWASRLMADEIGDVGLPFLSLGRAAARVLPAGGSPGERLRVHLAALTSGAESARRDLVRIAGWTERARSATLGIKGNNPSKIIATLRDRPLSSTATIERTAGISRDTAERLLARLQEMGLVREVTGAKRFRIWAARTGS